MIQKHAKYLNFKMVTGNFMKDVLDELFESVKGERNGAFVFVPGELGPGILNVGTGAVVDGTHVGLYELGKHLAGQEFSVERLGLDLLENPLAETDDLLNELGPQGLELDLVQVLQVLLVIRGSEQAKTVSSVK